MKYLIVIALVACMGALLAEAADEAKRKQDIALSEFAGTYKFEKDDGNFESLLKETGTSFFVRKIVIYLTPTIDFTVNPDGSYQLKTTTTFKNSQIDFKLGEKFEEKRMDGVLVKTSIKRDGNKLIQIQETDPPIEITREFFDDKLIITSKCNGVTNVREYKKTRLNNGATKTMLARPSLKCPPRTSGRGVVYCCCGCGSSDWLK